MDREDALESGLPVKKINRAELDPAEKEILFNTLSNRGKKCGHLYVFDTNNCSINTIYAKIKELEPIYKFDLIVVDYLGIMKPVEQYSAIWERERQIAIELKQLARKLNKPIVTVMQIRKSAAEQSKTREFEPEDMALSYEIFMQSDILFTWQVKDETTLINDPTCVADVVLKKVRNNKRGRFSCLADFSRMSITECYSDVVWAAEKIKEEDKYTEPFTGQF